MMLMMMTYSQATNKSRSAQLGWEWTIYTVSQKNCANLFLSALCQISTNFDNFWQKDGKEAKIMRDVLIFHHT